ncbi:Zinc finger MYND-type protein [Venturia nashicola]|nr:Zinc finger MYND-type protein [Venturia nashicola]
MPSCDNTNCDNNAKLYCSNCSDAPTYDYPQNAIYYCSVGCQSAHWPKHHFFCKVRRQRKKLFRVATLLHAMVEAYEESVLEFELRKIDIGEGDDPTEPSDATSGMGAVQNPYTLPMSLLCSISNQLLRALATTFSILHSTIGYPSPSDKSNSPLELLNALPVLERRHQVLMITLKSGENWVIDFNRKVLIPMAAYLSENECRDIESRIFDFIRVESEEVDDDTDAIVSMDEDEAEMELEAMPSHSPQNWFAQYIKLRIEGNRTFRKKLIGGSIRTFQAMVNELQGDVKGLVTACLMETVEKKVVYEG